MFSFDLSTFLFQAVNFLILLLVLSRFLYRPLLRVMKEREAEVAARLREAEERQSQAEAERAELASGLVTAQHEAAEIVAAARTEAARQAEELLDRARQQARATEEAGRQRLHVEEDAVRRRLERSLRATAVELASSLVRQTAGEAVHRALLERVLHDGISLNGPASEAIGRVPPDERRPIRWELAYPPGPDLAARLRHATAETVGQPEDALDVEVRVEPSLVAGWRLAIGTWAVDLSLRRTLEELGNDGIGPDGEPDGG